MAKLKFTGAHFIECGSLKVGAEPTSNSKYRSVSKIGIFLNENIREMGLIKVGKIICERKSEFIQYEHMMQKYYSVVNNVL